VTFSIAQRMHRPLAELSGLSLAAGVAVAQTLRASGAAEVALKWPNDLVARGAKLGGILVETRGAGARPTAVIGIGINWRAAPGLGERLRREVIALDQLLDALPARSTLIARIAAALLDALTLFDAGGLGELRTQWEALHAHAGQRIRVRLADGRVVTGRAAGISGEGALQLRTRRGLRDIHSARVVVARAARDGGALRRTA
jgi:BirA family biotin operon repressor/biotin-[acetyl-CoA-carboxylase] ligase